MTRIAAGLLATSALLACGSGSKAASGNAASTLRAAASATARAHSFTATLPGAEITYDAPDHVQQVEHGEATSARATNGGAASSVGPHPSTITKIFVGDRYYEADSGEDNALQFSSSQRCPNDQNTAEFVLRYLRAIALATDVQLDGTTYTFHLKNEADSRLPASGTATIDAGFVRTLSVAPSVQTVTIASINSAPPVTAPASSTPTNVTCG